MTTLGAGIPQAKISPTCIYTSHIWPPLDPSCTCFSAPRRLFLSHPLFLGQGPGGRRVLAYLSDYK